ncbi:TRAP transporter small permease [Phytoactinopolyspora limicola]|uniref:TRAP transporter small permease n=1 Tax=Phytoactinopolyspora limicola TaxID=2715536 RepID=UPI0014078820|nr:TRAP transporter small permease [Phytoactinopolyspora limicola]
MESLLRLVDRIVEVFATIAGLLMVALTCVVTAAVVSRYAFDLPIRSTTEMSGLIFAWLVFLAAIAVTHRQDNIAVTYFRSKLPALAERLVEAAMKVLMLVFAGFLAYSSLQLTTALADQRLPALQISTSWLNGSVAVAFVGICGVLLVQIVVDLFFPHLRKSTDDSELAQRAEGAVGGVE